MSLSTLLLIAIAAAVVFIMYRVGRDTREAARAPGAAHNALPPTKTMGSPDGHFSEVGDALWVDDRGAADREADGEGRPERHTVAETE